MKIAIIGATGNVGAIVVAEALRRGHTVTGIARDPAKLAPRERLALVAGDANRPEGLAALVAGHDAVVSAVPFVGSRPASLLDAVRRSGVARYLVVGGAGSLLTADGTLHVDAPGFPAVVREEATRGKQFLDVLRGVDDLAWTMLSPAALLTTGERSGIFRLGGDTLLVADDGRSWISYDDYAIALVDELETPRHLRRRFTVGY